MHKHSKKFYLEDIGPNHLLLAMLRTFGWQHCQDQMIRGIDFSSTFACFSRLNYAEAEATLN